jgi:hypothetical protein
MIDWWSNRIFAIASPKILLIDTAATGLPPGEAVADPGSASVVSKVQDNIIDQDCAYRHKTDRHAPPWQLLGNDQVSAGIGPLISGILLYCRLSCPHNHA